MDYFLVKISSRMRLVTELPMITFFQLDNMGLDLLCSVHVALYLVSVVPFL